MKIYKLIYPDTAENEYKVELEIEVDITPPDYSNDASDWDYLGMTELIGFEIISVQKRTCVQNPDIPRQKADVLLYNWDDVLMDNIPLEERQELEQEINKEVMQYVNC